MRRSEGDGGAARPQHLGAFPTNRVPSFPRRAGRKLITEPEEVAERCGAAVGAGCTSCFRVRGQRAARRLELVVRSPSRKSVDITDSRSDTELLHQRRHVEVLAHRFRFPACNVIDLTRLDLDRLSGSRDWACRSLERPLMRAAPRDLQYDGVAAHKGVVDGGLGVRESGCPALPASDKLVNPLHLPMGGNFLV